ncbi:sensor histidine kinase [Rheinheimera pacifica]|uniref:histidine kinase n=1 Tax=Rheinheimera pacifica TaxID=173990 RepID=A0A1H6MGZ0_9GAMM|nr:HAMP domain-containing sensor histidine kinase [Rheinheimera pacifica]SEI00880.1 Signal transduction histidine kinase [Rheinheimera pacifica]
MHQLFWRFFLVFWATLLMAVILVRLTFTWDNTPRFLPSENMLPAGAVFFATPSIPATPLIAAHNINPSDLSKSIDISRLPAPPFWRHPLLHLSVLLAASILFSWVLARNIAAPVRQLKQALAGLAANNWRTQLGPELITRRDEFGSLSRNFNQMAGQAAEAIASQRRLLHDVSHELRSPLARMQILTGLAAQSPSYTAMAMEKIEQEATKLDELVTEILTFSRLESGAVCAEHIDINLAELVASVCDDARLEADSSNKSLWLHLENVPLIKGDPSLLYSAIENVIRNAVKYTPPYSEVSVCLRQHQHQLSLQVRDQGPGVPPQYLSKLFTPFFRAQSSHNGIGLGLSIAKRAAEACNGSIAVANIMTNNEITGFSVVISLPLNSSVTQVQ